MNKFRLRAGALIIKDEAVLLIQFKNDHDDGVHYNLPAGGVEPGETLAETAVREAKEEACVDIEVGPVAFVYEYQPAKNNFIYGDVHSVGVTFECRLKEGSLPMLPDSPHPHQIRVEWVPLSELNTIQLYPEIARDIINYHYKQAYRSYVEEHEIQAGT
ncbi:NUDIX domain-containing protein [Paenibacillus pinihumi]|uniref:NUDIX domain-containing protein n=1 Tax=Paenibacillus pinihumi TaxID=669462 RepID=UPI000414F4BA|nr:NUDIX domain-containing protein [Paenibacillus pinihumi]